MEFEGKHSDDGNVQERVDRYASLRAAFRAISPSLHPEKSVELQERVQELGSRVRHVATPDKEAQEGSRAVLRPSLEAIDWELDDFSRELLSLVSELSMSQLRATLPALQARNPDELLALLDVCIADERNLSRRLNLLDYLITLASTDTDSALKRVARDPATLTPALEALCEKAGVCPAEAVAELTREFDAGRAEIERGEPIGPARQQLRRLKKTAATRLLAPQVLRANVAFNGALWNRLEELKEIDRTLETAESQELESLESGESASTQHPQTSGSSVLESEGIRALESALCAQLQGSPEASGGAADVVQWLEVDSLSRHEKQAFTERADDPSARLLRIAVAVGLILRRLDDVPEILAEIGTDRALLRDAWIPELASQLLASTQARLSAGSESGEAQQLAEVRTKLLRLASEKSLWSGKGRTRGDGKTLSAGALTSRAQPRRDLESPIRIWPLALGACLLGLAVVGFLRLNASPETEFYSPARVESISPYLEAAHRTDSGSGPLLVGTLGNDWAKLPEAERAAIGRQIAKELSHDGIDHVMLFDGDRHLAIHYADGKLRYAARPD